MNRLPVGVIAVASFVAVSLTVGCGEKVPLADVDVLFPNPDPPKPGADTITLEPPSGAVEPYESAEQAVVAILALRPRVIGFGEYHATIGGPNVVPSLSRFRESIMPEIARYLSDIVVETYVEPSGCGAEAQKTATEVKAAIERPPETENEVFALLRESRERKLGAHILEMSCADYESLRTAGQVDYQKTLSIMTERLHDAITKTLEGKSSEDRRAVAVYGGTMHNDLHPIRHFEEFTYAPRIHKATGASYVEVDVFVPELIADSKLFVGQEWFELAKKHASPDKVIVIPRGPNSFVVVLKSGVTSKAAP